MEKWEPSCTVGWNVNWRTEWRPSDGSDNKESACNTRDPGWISWLGRSPGEENGNPLKYSCLDNSMELWNGIMAGYTPWDLKELDTTELLTFSFFMEVS